MVPQTCIHMRRRANFLFACCIIGSLGIYAFAYLSMLRLKVQSVKRPYSAQHSAIIEPSTWEVSHFRIFDVVLNGDPFQSESVTIYLNTYRYHITWSAFMCFFPWSNVTTLGVIDRRSHELLLTCLLPNVELAMIKSGRHSFQISLLIKFGKSENETYFTSEPKRISVYRREKHGIAIYTMIRNRRNEIIDWIEYHRMIGVEHFYLYDHLSEDQIDTYLEYYLKQGIVTIFKWPFEPMRNQHWNTIQCASMNHALKNFGPFNRWMGYFDVDEYFQLNSTNAQLIESKNQSLTELFDRSFPVTNFPGGAQFLNCPISCFLSEREIVAGRHLNIFQKCSSIVEPRDCFRRRKLFIRPEGVSILQNIHAFEDGVRFSAKNVMSNFGEFRHYHYGLITGKGDSRGQSDNSMDRYIVNLTARISSFYRDSCLESRTYQ